MATVGVGIVSPSNLAGKDVDDGLLRIYWSNKIYRESLLVDVLMNVPYLTEPVDPGRDKDTFKLGENYAFHDITPGGMDKYSRSVRLQFTKSLSADAREGNAEPQLGFEENILLKWFSACANDWSHAVTTQEYGIDAREIFPSRIYQDAKPLLSQWLGEYFGYSARHALLERISPNLVKAPTSKTTAWNQNWHVVGLAEGSQPVYDSTDATYETNVYTAMNAVTESASHFTVDNILDLESKARFKYIKPLMWEGMELYFLYACDEEYTRLRKPSVAGSFGDYWLEVGALGSGKLNEIIPSAKFVIGNGIVVCRDVRAAALGIDVAAIASYYLKMGRNDQRIGIANTRKANVNMLIGAHALVKFQSEKPHFEDQYDEYKKFKGIGYFGACSYMIPAWDLDDDAKTDTSVQQEGSMVCTTVRTSA